jgi:predicted PurR-regulated permease PerM
MPPKTAASPSWTGTSKLIAGFTLVAIAAALLVRFSGFVGPLLMAFILSYLLHPLVRRFSETIHVSWRGSVGIVFLVVLLALITLLTWAGVGIVDQLGNLINIVQDFFNNLPETLRGLSEHAVQIGPFQINFSEMESNLVRDFGMDFAALGQELLGAVQPILGGAGTFLGAVATSTITTIGWILFVFIVTYLILNDLGRAPDLFRNADLPGHDGDLRRLGDEVGRIWNTYLRSQLFLVGLIMFSSFVLMSLLGVRFALALAVITGLAKFIPYVGSAAMYITTALVTFFQAENYLGIEPGTTYMLVATIPAFLMDLTFDNVVTPRIYGRALGVHPAAVLVTALVAANLLGVIGLLLAAPVLATIQLFVRYVLRKLTDQDPWPVIKTEPAPKRPSILERLSRLWQRLKNYVTRLTKPRKKKK